MSLRYCSVFLSRATVRQRYTWQRYHTNDCWYKMLRSIIYDSKKVSNVFLKCFVHLEASNVLSMPFKMVELSMSMALILISEHSGRGKHIYFKDADIYFLESHHARNIRPLDSRTLFYTCFFRIIRLLNIATTKYSFKMKYPLLMVY